MKPKIAIDVGSSYTKIYKSRADVVLFEPTCIALKNKNYKSPVAYGLDAYALIGKTPENVEVIFPVNNTEIKDFKALVVLLEYFIKKIKKPFEIISSALLSVQCGSNHAIIKNFENALIGAKIYNVCFAESPLLSLLGSGVELSYETPNAVIDFGGGQVTVCVLTQAGVISGASIEYGGNELNKLIVKHLEETLNLQISLHSAEIVKTQLASLDADDETKSVINGKDVMTGKQRVHQISACDIYEPVKAYVDKVLTVANAIFSSLQPETLNELSKNGILLVGGGVNIYALSDYVFERLGIKAQVLEEAEISSIIGAGKLVENTELLEKLKLKA